MKAHIRKTPTYGTYLEKLSEVIDNLDLSGLSPDLFAKMDMTTLTSEEYYEKMLKELRNEDSESE